MTIYETIDIKFIEICEKHKLTPKKVIELYKQNISCPYNLRQGCPSTDVINELFDYTKSMFGRRPMLDYIVKGKKETY